MKIHDISCKQFAGLQLKDPITFSDGINIVYGKNESGKSTLVNLISRLLFQNAHFGKSDKGPEFKRQYFPITSKGQSDNAGGTITLETKDGRYILNKIWGAKESCELETPEDTKMDQDNINQELKEILTYGEGVYSKLLLSSQNNTNQVLQELLTSSQKIQTKQEITEAVTQIFAAADGLSADAIERRINEIIDGKKNGKDTAEKNGLASNWDVEQDMPIGGPLQEHRINKGAVLQAYYYWQDAKKELDKMNKMSDDADRAAEEYRLKEEAAKKAAGELKRYKGFSETLEKTKRKEENEKTLNTWKNVATEWPGLEEKRIIAEKLEAEQNNRNKIDLYNQAKEYEDEIQDLKNKTNGRACPEKKEIRQVKEAQRKIQKLENDLRGMNIQALVNMYGGHTLKAISLRTGEPLDLQTPITEAVKLTIPGVMEMELAPAKVDVQATQDAILTERNLSEEILKKYDVKDLQSLEDLEEKLSKAYDRIRDLKDKRSALLKGKSFQDIEDEYLNIPQPVRSAEEIQTEIECLCGENTVGNYRAGVKTTITLYIRDYISQEKLKEDIAARENVQKKLEDELAALPEIPEEYQMIKDFQEHLSELRTASENKARESQDAKEKKSITEDRLMTYLEDQDRLGKDPVEDEARACRDFEEKKTLLHHWIHIRDKFQEQKKQIQEHPLEDLTKKFTEYLGIISGGHVSSDQPDPNKLDLNIQSGNRQITYDLLSEGTKGTVSLAFRLAVVDHLFPNGGGIIVLDDPLTDMDEDRVKQSCELIRECAKRHQVIFLTCREEYQNYLNGNLIRI